LMHCPDGRDIFGVFRSDEWIHIVLVVINGGLGLTDSLRPAGFGTLVE
jgi:hypothetical protein